MSKSCKTCKHFDIEASRLGGKNVKSMAMVKCDIDIGTLKWPKLSSLPYNYQAPRKPPVLLTCANYGSDCDLYEKRVTN